jgi:hypothetical protein
VRVGDLVLYTNPQRLISPTLGIIIEEHNDISMDHRFFTVLLHTGRKQIISDHYISHPGEKQPVDDLGS